MQSKVEIDQIQIPQEFITFMDKRLEKKREGGRPNFLKVLSKERNSIDEVLNILELAWLKNKSYGRIAKKYFTSYYTIYRLIRDLEPLKESLFDYLLNAPRRKVFYNRDLNTSDYETVRSYIKRARRDGLKNYKRTILTALKCWRSLGYKDPGNWTPDEVVDYLSTLTYGAASVALDAIRQVAPQIREDVRTGRYREKLRRRKKDIFAKEFMMIVDALRANNLAWEEVVFKLHVTLGAREGKTNSKSGICGLSWDRFHKKFTRVDLWESKVRGGLWSRNCLVGLLFRELPQTLSQIWMERGKPTAEKLIIGGYPELLNIYKRIRAACCQYWEGRTEPDILKELTSLKPHDADKIHVNLLWEAEVPLEVVAGKNLGRGEGIGLMGRIWLSTDTIKKYYLSLTERSERIQKLRVQVQKYSNRFNGMDGYF